ncbi:hypothetical protein [Pseudothermotoga sp.]
MKKMDPRCICACPNRGAVLVELGGSIFRPCPKRWVKIVVDKWSVTVVFEK